MAEELIIDQFRLENCIATGSLSQIWEVTDQETNDRFAMKLLLEEAFRGSGQKAILKREYKIAKSFDHPSIIQVFAHKQSRKHAYYIMEYFGGPNLKQIIRGDRLVVHTRLRKFIECLTMALGHIHEKGWLHRDIKPDNIMMTKSSDVRLIDFSLSAKKPSAVKKMVAGKAKIIQGTRTYLAPELIRKKLPSEQSDLYSLGITIFECLTGRPPFLGSSPNDLLIRHVQEPSPHASTFNENVTPEMDKLLLRLLAKKPEDRPTNAGELLSEFRSVKIFEQDPQEFDKILKAREKEAAGVTEDASIDSRADAQRSERINAGLEVEEKKAPPVKKTPVTPQQKTPQTPAATNQTVPAPQLNIPPQPAPPTQPPMIQQPQYPQQPQPGYPQQPMMPQQPVMQPQGWQPGQQMPGYPPQQIPGQPISQPPAGGIAPPPGQPQVPQQATPTAQPPAKKNPPAAAPVTSKEIKKDINLDDLPLMEELPDIS